jgi:hypothetical protein
MTIRARALPYVLITTAVMAIAVAAGASIATAPSPTLARQWHDPYLPPSTAAADPNEAAAIAEARRLSGLVDPAPGWAPTAAPPAPSLAAPATFEATPNIVDLYRLWRTSTTPEVVEAWVAAHRPTGSNPAGSGSSNRYGRLLETDRTYAYPPIARRFQSRQLLVSVAPLPRGGTGIRVDAQVVWFPSRPAAEEVPPGATRATATVYVHDHLSGSAETVLGSATFVDPSVVRLLVHLVDSLPLAVPGARSCPSDNGTAPQLDVVFSGRGIPEVVVHDDTNGCGGVSFRIGGTSEAPLTDNGLFHRVDGLLGLDLPRVDDDP